MRSAKCRDQSMTSPWLEPPDNAISFCDGRDSHSVDAIWKPPPLHLSLSESRSAKRPTLMKPRSVLRQTHPPEVSIQKFERPTSGLWNIKFRSFACVPLACVTSARIVDRTTLTGVGRPFLRYLTRERSDKAGCVAAIERAANRRRDEGSTHGRRRRRRKDGQHVVELESRRGSGVSSWRRACICQRHSWRWTALFVLELDLAFATPPPINPHNQRRIHQFRFKSPAAQLASASDC